MTRSRTALPVLSARGTPRRRRTAGRATGSVVLALGLALAAGCTGDESADPGEATGSPGAEGSPGSPEAGADSAEESPGAGTESPGTAAIDAPGAGTRYCDLLGTDFSALFADIQGPDDVDQAMSVIGDIVDEAPGEVTDAWQTMEGALGQMQEALASAAQLQQDATSGDLSDKQLAKRTEKLMAQMQALDTPENNAAGDEVAAHASEYCGIQLQ